MYEKKANGIVFTVFVIIIKKFHKIGTFAFNNFSRNYDNNNTFSINLHLTINSNT